MKHLEVKRGTFAAVAFSADGRYLLSLDSRRILRFWEVPAYEERLRLILPDTFGWTSHRLMPADRHLVLTYGVWDIGAAWDWLADVAGGKQRRDRPVCPRVPLEGVAPSVVLSAIGGSGQILGVEDIWAWGSGQRQGRIWRTSGTLVRRFRVPPANGADLTVTADGRLCATSEGYTCTLFDLEQEKLAAELNHTDGVNRMCFSPDGRFLGAGAGRSAWLWDLRTFKPLTRYPAFAAWVSSVAFHPSSELMAAGSRTGEVRLWHTSTLREAFRFDPDIGAVRDLAFSPDGMTIAAAGWANRVAVWDIE